MKVDRFNNKFVKVCKDLVNVIDKKMFNKYYT